jgi:hypothetical protein
MTVSIKSSLQGVLDGIGQMESDLSKMTQDFAKATADVKKLKEDTEKKMQEELNKLQAEGQKKVASIDAIVQEKLKTMSEQIASIETNLVSKIDEFRIKYLAPIEKRGFENEEKIKAIEKRVTAIDEKFKKIKEIV